MIFVLFLLIFLISMSFVVLGYHFKNPVFMVIGGTMFLIMAFLLLLDGVQAQELEPTAIQESELYKYCWESHSPICDNCYFDMWCLIDDMNSDFKANIKTTDFSPKAVNSISKESYLIVSEPTTEKSELNIQTKDEIIKDKWGRTLFHHRADWSRDQGHQDDVVDYIPCVDIGIYHLCFENWSEWNPTTFLKMGPANDSIQSSPFIVWANGTDTSAGRMFIEMNYTNGTNILSKTRMNGSWWIEADGDLGQDVASAPCVQGNCAQHYAYISNEIYDPGCDNNLCRLEIPANWNSSTWGPGAGNLSFDVWTGGSSYCLEGDSWITGTSGLSVGQYDAMRINVSSVVSDGDYYFWWASDSGNNWNMSFDNITYQNFVGSGCIGFQSVGQMSVSDGAFDVYYTRAGGSWTEFGDFRLTTYQDAGNWSYMIDTADYPSGVYTISLIFENLSSHANIIQFNVTILQSTNPATCDPATIDADHFFYNFTKLLSPDPALSMSGCIMTNYWDNGTAFNSSWAPTTDNWFNLTNENVLQFYGLHRLFLSCNDSINTWVTCSQDTYSVSETGGLTDEQARQLLIVYVHALKELMATDYICLDNQTLQVSDTFNIEGEETTISYNKTCSFGCVSSQIGGSDYCRETRNLFIDALGMMFIVAGASLLIKGFYIWKGD